MLGTLVTFSALGETGHFNRALEAYKNKDYEQALRRFRAAAGPDNPAPFFYLGVMYEKGLGIEADANSAERYYRKAAKQGHPQAGYNLGLLYASRDRMDEAVRFWERAAEAGSQRAQYNLGDVYLKGKGVAQDLEAARHWWERAAEAGFAPAQYNLASLYYYGRGVSENHTEALYWYRQAARQGDPNAEKMVGQLAGSQADKGDLTWLRRQDAAHYTIQLLAVRDKKRARGFIAQRDAVDAPLRWFAKDWDGQRGYVVVHGSYENRPAARDALKSLGDTLKANGAWIRSLGTLQREAWGDGAGQ